MTLDGLAARYAKHWLIQDGAGGFIAVRRHGLPETTLAKWGLSNVVCGATLAELGKRLAVEREREKAAHQ
jgi:hypothetical protein